MSEAYEYTVMSLERRIIVFVTGCPGSGKSHFAGILKEKFPFFYMSAYDKTKELFFDKYGFDSLEERAELNKKSLSAYYSELAMEMEKGVPIIAEYPLLCNSFCNAIALFLFLYAPTCTLYNLLLLLFVSVGIL